jgi:UDP-N-acetylglucosamine:LPS N-acetylglucosamine transferase
MVSAYRVADLVISRAGAGTLFELELFRKPAVLVPYEYAFSHQYENAFMFSISQRIWVHDAKVAMPKELADKINWALEFEHELSEVGGENPGNFKIDDGTHLVQLADSLLKSDHVEEKTVRRNQESNVSN